MPTMAANSVTVAVRRSGGWLGVGFSGKPDGREQCVRLRPQKVPQPLDLATVWPQPSLFDEAELGDVDSNTASKVALGKPMALPPDTKLDHLKLPPESLN